MKKILAIMILVFALSSFGESAFCEGWEVGYKTGWCYGHYYCMAPMTPMCPMARMGEDNYIGGYNRGFLFGLNARKENEGN